MDEGALRLLVEQRDQLLAEMEALRNRIAGFEMAIGVVSDAAGKREATPNGKKVGVSETLLSLLRESGEAGLKPKAVIELAAGRGINLKRGSVYSLLNRMERAGTVVHENTIYKLKEFARRRDRVGLPMASAPTYPINGH